MNLVPTSGAPARLTALTRVATLLVILVAAAPACTKRTQTQDGPGLAPETSQAAVVEGSAAAPSPDQAAPEQNEEAMAHDAATHESVEQDAVTEAVNLFGAALFARAAADGDDNVLLSPVSVAVALHMTLAGASGETRAEMERALEVAGLGDGLHAASGAFQRALSAPGASTAEIANRVWVEQQWDERIRPAFRETLATDYDGGMELVDFIANYEAARGRINAWVAEQTRDKIPELIPQGALTSLTRLVLTNAVYFDANWMEPFDEDRTIDAAFATPDGEVEVPTMHSHGELRYARHESAQVVTIPYEEREWEMVVVLPDAGALAEVEADAAAVLDGAMAQLRTEKVNLALPKFTFRWSGSLVDTLKALGMRSAFGRDADFSRMADLDGTDGLYVSDVLHEAFVEVDEEGTEAAAATAVIVATRAAAVPRPVIDFRVDRPFLFAIRHVDTGAWLFLGRVTNPVSE